MKLKRMPGSNDAVLGRGINPERVAAYEAEAEERRKRLDEISRRYKELEASGDAEDTRGPGDHWSRDLDDDVLSSIDTEGDPG